MVIIKLVNANWVIFKVNIHNLIHCRIVAVFNEMKIIPGLMSTKQRFALQLNINRVYSKLWLRFFSLFLFHLFCILLQLFRCHLAELVSSSSGSGTRWQSMADSIICLMVFQLPLHMNQVFVNVFMPLVLNVLDAREHANKRHQQNDHENVNEVLKDGSETVVATCRRHVETFTKNVAGSLVVVVEHVQRRLLLVLRIRISEVGLWLLRHSYY